ncbi:MAG TPA: nuclear transport factor 2 family protein [Gaiellaceae bacterium]|nr:nuclear transport factor 2 family protein [Gaiellaceae bacterium]
MDRSQVTRWLEAYVAAWKSGERDEIRELFGEDVRYRYHPWDEPLVGRDAVADSWLEEPDPPGSFEARYECFAVEGDSAVAVGASTYRKADGTVSRVYDNVFLLRFDADGRCSDFTEWFMERPR